MASDTDTFEGEPVRYPGGNPKHAHGLAKVPMRLAPASARIELAMAFRDGAQKYGPYNWRVTGGIAASVYIDAMQRHMDAWFDGEDRAEDSGVHHLGHAMACASILIDAAETGGMIDDRPAPGNASAMQKRYQDAILSSDVPELRDDAKAEPVKQVHYWMDQRIDDMPQDQKIRVALDILVEEGYEFTVLDRAMERIEVSRTKPRKTQADVRDPSFMRDPIRPTR